MAVFELVEGWTGPLDFVLKADGVVVDLTGMTVDLLLTGKDGSAIDTTADVTVPTPASGLVRYSPDAADVLLSKTPLKARWKVTDGAGKVVFFPNGMPDIWQVYKA
jgi:hypothetical protein